jgi:Flp pilus assembly pilin Flp
MLKRFCHNKGQSVSGEYVLLIALASIAIVGMTIYVRRALQARYRDANQAVYMKASATLGNQVRLEYEPYYANTATDTDTSALTEESVLADGRTNRTDVLNRNLGTFSTQMPF